MHEDQFSAIGPAQSGSSFPYAGFSNQATNKPETTNNYGVNVIGTECGVYGESLKNQSRRRTEKGTGVCGKGDKCGVFGQGDTCGVFGRVQGGIEEVEPRTFAGVHGDSIVGAEVRKDNLISCDGEMTIAGSSGLRLWGASFPGVICLGRRARRASGRTISY